MAGRSLDPLSAEIKGLAGRSTADLIGIAPGEAFSEEELGELGRAFGPVRSVVVLAQHIVDPVQTVRFQSGRSAEESEVAASFGDALLRDACWRVVEALREAGWRAAILRNMRYGFPDPRHGVSYKKAAALAGLGAFGRNQLLIHPEWGPWLYLRAVVTDALLPTDSRSSFSPCADCGRCIEACPAGALSEQGFNRSACELFYKSVGAGQLRLSPHGRVNCEECMRACPVGTAPPRLAVGQGNHG
jgi:epoxyqueuosine reductase QueG